MLQGHIEIWQDLPFGHQRDQVIDTRVRVDIMKANPDAEFGQRLAQFLEPCLDRPAADKTRAVLDIDAVCTRVLGNHQQLTHAGLCQILRLLQHITDRTAHQRTAQRGNDAESTSVIAAFRNLQVREMLRRQTNALRRHETGEWIVRLRQMRMHMLHDFFRRVWPGNRQHLRVRLANQLRTRPQAAGNDHLAVFGKRFANRF